MIVAQNKIGLISITVRAWQEASCVAFAACKRGFAGLRSDQRAVRGKEWQGGEIKCGGRGVACCGLEPRSVAGWSAKGTPPELAGETWSGRPVGWLVGELGG